MMNINQLKMQFQLSSIVNYLNSINVYCTGFNIVQLQNYILTKFTPLSHQSIQYILQRCNDVYVDTIFTKHILQWDKQVVLSNISHIRWIIAPAIIDDLDKNIIKFINYIKYYKTTRYYHNQIDQIIHGLTQYVPSIKQYLKEVLDED